MSAGIGQFEFTVKDNENGLRLDAFIASRLPQCSRSQAAQWIREGIVTADNLSRKPGYKIKVQEKVCGRIPAPTPSELIPENIDLDILFEDRTLIVVNKPPGLVVHPAAGHHSGTLVNALLYHCPDLEGIGGEKRPGIVHRLDKDTSGLLVVAKNGASLEHLSRQFKERSVEKRYLAIVAGVPVQTSGEIDLPVGRHPTDRKKMSVISNRGRTAYTMWRIKERFDRAVLLEVTLKTGRTHQIRVHCRAIGHPILGDPIYGPAKGFKHNARNNPGLISALHKADRQMLHAAQLSFVHPTSHKHLTFEAPLPGDMQSVMQLLRQQQV